MSEIKHTFTYDEDSFEIYVYNENKDLINTMKCGNKERFISVLSFLLGASLNKTEQPNDK